MFTFQSNICVTNLDIFLRYEKQSLIYFLLITVKDCIGPPDQIYKHLYENYHLVSGIFLRLGKVCLIHL